MYDIYVNLIYDDICISTVKFKTYSNLFGIYKKLIIQILIRG